MIYNKEIFLKFLEESDWNNEKTFNLFLRTFNEYQEKIKNQEEEINYYRDKFDQSIITLEETIKKYDNCIKLCEELKNENDKLKKKDLKTITTQTYIYNINKAEIDYNICDKNESRIVKNMKTISKYDLDIMYEDLKNIINNTTHYRIKNKDMIVLLCNNRKNLIKLMGKLWYNKCVKCVADYSSINEENQKELYENIILLFQEIFQNEW